MASVVMLSHVWHVAWMSRARRSTAEQFCRRSRAGIGERRRASSVGRCQSVVYGEFAGGLEDAPSGHLDGVVGEAFVEPAQQCYVDRGCHSVLPFMVHQYGEQAAVQVVHRVVLLVDAGGLVRVTCEQDLLRGISQF